MCGSCKGFINKKYFFQHKKICKTSLIPIPMSLFHKTNSEMNISDDYRGNVLCKLCDDEIGVLGGENQYSLAEYCF